MIFHLKCLTNWARTTAMSSQNAPKGTITARCNKEAANYLAINLALGIIEKEKSIEEARQFYAEMMMENESSEYFMGFIFDMPRRETADPDEALIDKSEMKKEDMQNICFHLSFREITKPGLILRQSLP